MPTSLQPGSPVLIRIPDPRLTGVDGEWLGRKLLFFKTQEGWAALAGADVETAPGPTTLKITAHSPSGTEVLDRGIELAPAHYRTGKLSVAPKFVSPSPEELRQIEADKAVKEAAFAASAPSRLWLGSFRAPVQSPPTDSFGTRRTFNGKLASIHKGMDFRAATGTPVHAGNAGRVVLARQLYYEGGCVVIDHGLGLMTIAMHLSRIDVKEGEMVATGQQVGLSGASGRATGPHLHWAVRWQGAYLDPALLLRLNLDGLR